MSLGDPKLEHIPAKDNRGELYFYAIFRMKNGGYGFEVMSGDDVREHAKKYSQSYNSSHSPWRTNFEEMAKKTVLKRALKYAPLKSDFVRGMSADESVKTELSDDMFSVPNADIDYSVETDEEALIEEQISVDAETGEVK